MRERSGGMEGRCANVGQSPPPLWNLFPLRVYKWGLGIERAVCPVGRDFSLPRLTPQNFGSDGTHTLGGLFNVIGIRAHNESHSPNSGAGCAHPGLYPLARTTWAPFPLSASWTSLAPSALGQNYQHKLFRGDNETLGSGRGKLCDPPGSRRGTLCLSDLGSLCSSVLAICPPVVSVL